MKNLFSILFLTMIFNSGNSQIKPGVVKEVDLNRYKGKWYEIARLPNWFERKLKCTSATYVLREDGRITVINSGNYIENPLKKSDAKGVAWIPDKNNPAKLKVQFFWPFSGDYWIMDLDKDYRYVLIGEPSFKYLWILAREKNMDDETYNKLLNKAIENGYDVKSIIRVEQNCN